MVIPRRSARARVDLPSEIINKNHQQLGKWILPAPVRPTVACSLMRCTKWQIMVKPTYAYPLTRFDVE